MLIYSLLLTGFPVKRVSPGFSLRVSVWNDSPGLPKSAQLPDPIFLGGGYWRLNPLLISCVPSTTPTPVPVLVKSTPALFAGSDAVSSALSYLKQNSDLS